MEEDPATVVLEPDKVDYLQEKAITRLKTRIANRLATCYYERLIRKGTFIIKDIKGLENYRAAKGGAVITCNHFHPNDNYAVWRAIRSDFKGGKRLYKVIKEGNYTNFGGFYGFMFRNCNTLPLSSNPKTMVNFLKAVKTLLSRGEKILVYPEQAMWWNYRKPRPLKSGAFRFAASAGVPVVPAFITMEDTEKEDGDGAPVQAMAEELETCAHRAFTHAYAFGENAHTVSYENSQTQGTCAYVADVLEGGDAPLVQMRGRFRVGDVLEVLSPSASFGRAFTVERMTAEDGTPVEDAKLVMQKLRLSCPYPLREGDILRRV